MTIKMILAFWSGVVGIGGKRGNAVSLEIP